ncbi:hypothetical protein [Aeromicrobium sp. CF3.5]|uniref:hypothetical protein n=1 Tax=Aeromicrobium sp. CF3.5 TaxID=3373078 RepID=UPI003EE5756B
MNTTLYAYPAEDSRGLGILSVSGSEERAANTAIVRVNDSGKIKVYSSAGNTDFNVGVQGYFTKTSDASSTGGFVPIEPERMVRTDTGVGLNVSPMQGGTQYTVQLAGTAGIPANATAVFANFRIRNAGGTTTGRGGLRVGPSDTTISMSNTSVLDYASDTTPTPV